MTKTAAVLHDKAIATSIAELKLIARRLRKIADAQDMGEPVGTDPGRLEAAASKVRGAVTDLRTTGPQPGPQ